MTDTQSAGGPVQSTIDRLRSDVDRLLDTALTRGEKALDAVGLKNPVRREGPAVDLIEGAEVVRVLVDLPGVSPGRVRVHLAGGVLTVSGDLPAADAGPGTTAHRRERLHGGFSRCVAVPVAVDSDSVTADLRDGLLTVTMRKQSGTVSRTIPVGGA